jgi:hypothetical protein
MRITRVQASSHRLPIEGPLLREALARELVFVRVDPREDVLRETEER